MQAGKTTLIALALLATAACSRPASNAAASADAAAASSEQQYQAAPDLTGASLTGDGRVELAGRASPGAAVRLTSPGAAPQFAAADPQGAWRLTIPPSAQPRLFGLSMSAGGRVVQAIGYLFVAPGAVARLRVGGGTQALASASHGGLAGVALDYDSKRAATLSGLASPGETVGLRADGVERGQAAADQAGRFVIALNGEPLAAGAHDFELLSPSGALRFSAELDAPTPLAGTPYAARRQGAAWRVDWITPGGGEQTTLIFERGGGAA